MNRDVGLGSLCVAGAAFCWGTTATLARVLFRDHDIHPFVAVELRLAIATILLGAWLAARRRRAFVIERRDVAYFTVLGVVALAGVQGSYYFSIATLGVGLAILLQYLAPTLIVIYDAMRGVPVGRWTVVAVACALGGTWMLVSGMHPADASPSTLHWAIGWSSAFLFAFYIVFSKRGLQRYPPETVLFYSVVIACAVWAVVTPPWRILAAGYPRDIWFAFIVLGVFSTLVPFALFNVGLRRLRASEAGIMATLEPVIAVAAAALFLKEGLRPLQILGAALVLTASMISSTQSRPGGVRPAND